MQKSSNEESGDGYAKRQSRFGLASDGDAEKGLRLASLGKRGREVKENGEWGMGKGGQTDREGAAKKDCGQ